MKRILALILTVALLAIALTSCAFNYEKNAASYATVSKDGFLAKLQAISITEQDYDDVSKRDALLNDAINKAILGKMDTDKKVSTGKATAPDKIFYCYYATNAEGNQFFTSKMTIASAASFQLGLSTTEGLNKLIEEKIASFDFTSGYKHMEGEKLSAGVASVSYTWEKITPATETTGKTTETISVSNLLVNLSVEKDKEGLDPALKALYEQLIAADKIGTILSPDADQKNVFKADENNSFKNAKINYVIDATSTAIDIEFDANDDKNAPSGQITDANGKKFDKGTLTYHIYPVNFIDVPVLDLDTVVTVLYTTLEKTTLDVFADKEKESDLLIKAKEYASAKKDFEDAKEEEKTAKEKVMNDKFAALKTLDADGKESKIVEAYRKSERKKLVNAYVSNIEKEVYKAVWKEIQAIEVKDLPKNAVDDVYDKLIDRYEYSFYEGNFSSSDSSSESAETNYAHYNKKFEEFLKAETTTGSEAEAKAAVRKQAEDLVRQTIQIYALAEVMGAKLVRADYTKEGGAYKNANEKLDFYAQYGLSTFTDQAKYTAMQFDKVMKAVTAHSEADGVITWNLVKTQVKAEG